MILVQEYSLDLYKLVTVLTSINRSHKIKPDIQLKCDFSQQGVWHGFDQKSAFIWANNNKS